MDGCVSNTRISDKHFAIKDPMQSVEWAVRKHSRQLQEFRARSVVSALVSRMKKGARPLRFYVNVAGTQGRTLMNRAR
jgi:hypothetical protein